jgi:hypothetical protein
LIYLDFDGVLFDTAREAYIITMLAKNRDISTINEIEYDRFLEARSCVMAAWNYEAVMNGLDLGFEGFELISFVNCEIAKGKSSAAFEFEQEFFKRREKFHLENRDEWLQLSKPFSFWHYALPIIENNLDKFVILSTRDRESISEILAFYKSPPILILGRHDFDDAGKSKLNLIKNFSNQVKSLWIDDSIQHLRENKIPNNIKTTWARWGYLAPQDRLDNVEDVIAEIKKFLQLDGIGNV